MSSVAVFFVFVLVMLALATLAIILDWMGKPIRRSFRPRTTGTPVWLLADAPDPAAHAPAAMADAPDPSAIAQPEPPAPPPAPEPAGHLALNPASHNPASQEPRSQHEKRQDAPSAPGPWQAGDSIFKPTPRGTAPSIPAVRRRYWKNLSERASSAVFGEENRILMAVGQPPQRFNPRTSAIEELSLPEPMLRHCWATKRKPTPTWGDTGTDPFGRP
ncbi:MAG: hypothetical protein OXF64_05945 [bacterium]|nr:hypothetical protein [bacterium]MCY4272451.1 hypothetical protein [bacterium]